MAEFNNMDAAITEEDVEAAFQALLGRPVGDDAFRRQLVAQGLTLRRLIANIRASDELKFRVRQEIELAPAKSRRDPVLFRTPTELRVTPLEVRRILIIGSCLSESWRNILASLEPRVVCDLYLFGADLPAAPAAPVSEYDFQLMQIPLRFLVPDAAFARLSQDDMPGHEALFRHAGDTLRHFLQLGMRWSREHQLLTFVFPFLVPQQNLVGRLLPRYDLRNPVYFVERLNELLAREMTAFENTYWFDLNEIIATHGRRFVQEDMFAPFNHGSFIADFDFEHDANRLEPPERATQIYEEKIVPLVSASWQQLVAMFRTLKQVDAVKMVVIDLDDTLWRGVIAETSPEEMPTTEGWPLGFWEALAILKRRGVLLAILSKNEETRVRECWDAILRQRLALEDFAIVKINWRPKADNMAEILDTANVLPRNVVYIDDNPAQRAEIKQAYPEIRVLGGTPLTWRHILLWSAETQVPWISAESERRTAMLQAQVAREEQRQALPREEFLRTLDVRMRLFAVGALDPRLSRVLELINKTNQFNTTAERWTREQCVAAMAAGATFHAFELADRFTDYGLVGVVIVERRAIRQFIMSCRVMGLEAEITAIGSVLRQLGAQSPEPVTARFIDTDRNLPCRDLYPRCGFTTVPGGWQRSPSPPPPLPDHIRLVQD